ncbi:COG4705 family protein [Calidifontibacter terrae]
MPTTTDLTATTDIPSVRSLLPKVPHVAAAFWVVKLLTTGMGEAISDWLVGISQYAAVVVGFVGFVVMITLQLRAQRYRPVLYWGTVAMVAVFGTMAADAVHVVLGVPYAVTTAAYALAVAVVLIAWQRVEGSISIHSVTTRRREIFYWATVLATFALGTAAGDLAAFTLHLGYLASDGVFALAMLVPLIGWRSGVLGPVASFWTAYVLTRPLGASFADWFAKPSTKAGGLGFTDAAVSLIALAVFAVFVAWLQRSGADQPKAGEPA